MTEIHIFLFSFPPPQTVTRSGNSAQQKALRLFSRGLGGREGPLMAEIYIFYFPNRSGIPELHSPCMPASTPLHEPHSRPISCLLLTSFVVHSFHNGSGAWLYFINITISLTSNILTSCIN